MLLHGFKKLTIVFIDTKDEKSVGFFYIFCCNLNSKHGEATAQIIFQDLRQSETMGKKLECM